MADDKKNIKRTKLYKEIRQDLLDQLERNGTYGKFFEDLVEDYMALWVIKNQLIEDIETRGVTCKYQNGKEQWGFKKNDSVSELSKTNAQMLKLLLQLGIKAQVPTADNYNEDDEL